jgi:hypothetical protein
MGLLWGKHATFKQSVLDVLSGQAVTVIQQVLLVDLPGLKASDKGFVFWG